MYDRVFLPAAQARGIMMDIMPYFKTSGMKGEDQQPWVWEAVFRDGKLYGLPYSTDTRMVYVNVRLSQEGRHPAHRAQDAGRLRQDHAPTDRRPAGELRAHRVHPVGQQLAPLRVGLLHGSGEWYDPKANRVSIDHPKNIAALDWEIARANELGGYAGVEAFRSAQAKSAWSTCSRPARSAPPSTPPRS